MNHIPTHTVKIGLPDWLVDVRHEATHSALPSLDVLRAACNVALAWLRTQYWESQMLSFQETEGASICITTFNDISRNLFYHQLLSVVVK